MSGCQGPKKRLTTKGYKTTFGKDGNIVIVLVVTQLYTLAKAHQIVAYSW